LSWTGQDTAVKESKDRVTSAICSLPAPFVELDLERMSSSGYAQADLALHQALGEMAQQSVQELAQNHPSRLRRKVLGSLQTHWPGLTLFADHPQTPMDNNGAERAIRPGTLGRKNYYGSASRFGSASSLHRFRRPLCPGGSGTE
jgi:hypothetical protein